MTRMQRITHFLQYFWRDSWLLLAFSVVFIALPVALMSWADYAFWFWIITGLNALNLAIKIYQYNRYIRFNR